MKMLVTMAFALVSSTSFAFAYQVPETDKADQLIRTVAPKTDAEKKADLKAELAVTKAVVETLEKQLAESKEIASYEQLLENSKMVGAGITTRAMLGGSITTKMITLDAKAFTQKLGEKIAHLGNYADIIHPRIGNIVRFISKTPEYSRVLSVFLADAAWVGHGTAAVGRVAISVEEGFFIRRQLKQAQEKIALIEKQLN